MESLAISSRFVKRFFIDLSKIGNNMIDDWPKACNNAHMRRISTEKRATILNALVEGNSVNSTARLCGCSKITILRLLADIGVLCERLHDDLVQGIQAERVQADEIWSFVHAKDKNLPDHLSDKPGYGSVWTWTALDADTKLMIAYHVGDRGESCAQAFMLDLASRLDNRIQLTTDGHAAYLGAVFEAFGRDIDYAQLVKLYGAPRDGQARYSPCECVGARKVPITGGPLSCDTSTSHVERSNLTLRMQQRRFTRLTNAHSKRFENHRHAVSLHVFHYNFIRKHQTLKTTPAVASGIANRPWTMIELVKTLEDEEAKIGGRLTDYLPASSK